MTADMVQEAVEQLRTQGKALSSRNVLRVLRNRPPRYKGCSFTDLLRILKYCRLPADARATLKALDDATDAAPTWTGDRRLLIIKGEHLKDVLMRLMQREAAAGHPVALFEGGIGPMGGGLELVVDLEGGQAVVICAGCSPTSARGAPLDAFVEFVEALHTRVDTRDVHN